MLRGKQGPAVPTDKKNDSGLAAQPAPFFFRLTSSHLTSSSLPTYSILGPAHNLLSRYNFLFAPYPSTLIPNSPSHGSALVFLVSGQDGRPRRPPPRPRLPNRGPLSLQSQRSSPRHPQVRPALQGPPRRRLRPHRRGPRQHGRSHGLRLPQSRRNPPQYQPPEASRAWRPDFRRSLPRQRRQNHSGLGSWVVEDRSFKF